MLKKVLRKTVVVLCAAALVALAAPVPAHAGHTRGDGHPALAAPPAAPGLVARAEQSLLAAIAAIRGFWPGWGAADSQQLRSAAQVHEQPSMATSSKVTETPMAPQQKGKSDGEAGSDFDPNGS